MGRRTKKTKEPDTLAYKFALAWKQFRDSMDDYFNEVDEIRVELSFESSYDAKTHHNFVSDEILFPREVAISPEGKIMFRCPSALSEKTFFAWEADSITATTKTECESLIKVINDEFNKYFKELGVSNFDELENKYIKKERELIEVFNNVDDFLRAQSLSVERKDTYAKLPYYGIF